MTEHKLALLGLLYTANILGEVEEIDNPYWPQCESYNNVRTPWIRVVTKRGTITVGWRKRVISIEWTGDLADASMGGDIVCDENTTHWANGCHAWGWDEAEMCLWRLWRDL